MITQKIEVYCKKCNKLAKNDEGKSSENWSVYDFNKKCECGGDLTLGITPLKPKTKRK